MRKMQKNLCVSQILRLFAADKEQILIFNI